MRELEEILHGVGLALLGQGGCRDLRGADLIAASDGGILGDLLQELESLLIDRLRVGHDQRDDFALSRRSLIAEIPSCQTARSKDFASEPNIGATDISPARILATTFFAFRRVTFFAALAFGFFADFAGFVFAGFDFFLDSERTM